MSHLIPWRWKASPLPSPLRNFSCQHKVRLQLWIWICGLRFGPGQDSPLAERGCDENWFCQGFNFLHVNILINLTCEDLNISDKCWLYLDWFCEAKSEQPVVGSWWLHGLVAWTRHPSGFYISYFFRILSFHIFIENSTFSFIFYLSGFANGWQRWQDFDCLL